MADKIIEHTFTSAGEHLTAEVSPEEAGPLTQELKRGQVAVRQQPATSPSPAPIDEFDEELEEMRARYAETTGVSPDEMVVERIVAGKTRFIKRAMIPDVANVGAQIAKDMLKAHKQVFDMKDQTVFSITCAALMMFCVVKGKGDPTPVYSEALAWSYAKDPAASGFVIEMYEVITKINPALAPKSLGVSAATPGKASGKGALPTTSKPSPAKRKPRTSRSGSGG